MAGALLASSADTWAGDPIGSGTPASKLVPDLELREPITTLGRLPIDGGQHLLNGLLSPYLSLGSRSIEAGDESLSPGLRREPGLRGDFEVGAGISMPLSSRLELFGEYSFLKVRPDSGLGRGLLERQADPAGLKAGFSIRLD